MSIASAIQLKQQQVAAAYTACDEKGATMPAAGSQNLSNLASTISTISGGGPAPATKQYTVTWYDYDGTVLKEDTVDEGGSSTAPTVPSHQHLTFREWVHGNTITNVTQDYFNIARHAYLDDGLMLKVNIGADLNYTLTVGIYKASNTDPVVFDWGDGTTDTHTASDRNAFMTHTYSTTFTGYVRVYSSSGANIQNLNNNYTLRELGVEEYYYGNKFALQARPWCGRYNIAFKAVVLPDTLTALPIELFFTITPKVLAIPPTVTTFVSGSTLWVDRSSVGKLEAVNIPQATTTIGNDVFYGCSSLKYVTKDIYATSIGNRVFSECSSLKGELCFQSNITSFGGGIFLRCGLKKISIPNGTFTTLANLGGGMFSNCTNLEEVILPNPTYITSIGVDAFIYCSKLKKITNLPTNVTSIGQTAFAYCSSLEGELSFTGVTTLGNGVFHDSGSLTKISLEGTFTTLGNSNGGTFTRCTSLVEVLLPQSLPITTIANDCFSNCTSLKTITNFPKNVTSVGQAAFWNCYELETPIEFTSLTALGNAAFKDCRKIPSAKLGGTFTTLGNAGGGCFQNCYELVSVELPNTVTTFGNACFNNCLKLESVPLPTSLTTIADGAFSNLPSITELTLPDTQLSIGGYFCYRCNNLHSLHIGANVTISNNTVWLDHATALTYIDCTDGWVPNKQFNCYDRQLLASSIETFFTHLGDNTGNSAKVIRIGSENLAKLTTAQKEIATNKNYTLS